MILKPLFATAALACCISIAACSPSTKSSSEHGDQDISSRISRHITVSAIAGGAVFAPEKMIEWSNKDTPNGWRFQRISWNGQDASVWEMDPFASWPAHSSPSAHLGYVMEGGCKLYLGPIDGKGVKEMALKAGDYVCFEPGTDHAWVNGDIKTRLIFIKVNSTKEKP